MAERATAPRRHPPRRRQLLQGAAACVAAAAGLARAASDDALQLVVPFGAGGRTSFFAESLAPALQQVLGRPVRVSHSEGVGPVQAIRRFAASVPDGRTLLLAQVRLPRRGTLDVDDENRLLDSLVPVTLVAREPMVLLMSPRRADSLGIRTAQDLLRHLRAHPGRLSIATGVDGTTTHLASELFKVMTRTWLLRMPATGFTADAEAVAEGRIDMLFGSLHAARGSIRINEFRALGVTSDAAEARPGLERLAPAPVPPLLQQVDTALAGFAVYDYQSLLAPPGTPPAVVQALHAASAEALAGPLRARLLANNALPGGDSPARYREVEDEEAERWRRARGRW
ncbi:MAG: hypothetical protein EOP81_10385 [Variovorax sp.]|nr:MAG: hypothetical protein EOP81_10385 [Variovorax sp.]